MENTLTKGAEQYPDLWDSLHIYEREALKLVNAVHQGRDKDTWGGLRYWDQLVERSKLSRIAGPTLKDWWNKISSDMGVQLWAHNRAEVAQILADPNPKTLETISEDTEYIIGCVFRLFCDNNKKKKTAPKKIAPSIPQEELPL